MSAGDGDGAGPSNFEEWLLLVEKKRRLDPKARILDMPGGHLSYESACTCRTRQDVVDFELSGRAGPSRELWNEDAVLRAMRSESSEPSFEDFYNRGQPIDEPIPVTRYSLAELGGWESGRLTSLLRSGVPVVITDAYASLPDFFKYSWTCEDFERRFGRYTTLSSMYNTNADELEDQSFRDFFKLLGSGSGTLYWGGPKDMANTEYMVVSPLLRGSEEGIIGLPPIERNACFASQSSEFWFQTPKAGARQHLDSHCCNTISIGLNGDKEWEIGPVDSPQRHPAFTPKFMENQNEAPFRTVYGDGFYGSETWRPVFKTTVHEGEGIIFPPFMLHRTYAVRGPDGSTADNPSGDLRRSCTNSLTLQFDYPLPSAYLRAYWPRLSSVPDALTCIPGWHRALALDRNHIEEVATKNCGNFCSFSDELNWASDAAGESMRSMRARDTAIDPGHVSRIEKMGNATHFSILGDFLFPPDSLQSQEVDTYTLQLLTLDAAHALSSLSIEKDDRGDPHAFVSKEDLLQMLARLDSARDKYSRDLQSYEVRSAVATLMWRPLYRSCALENNLVRIFSYGGISSSSISLSEAFVLSVGFQDLERGVGLPNGSGLACRAFYGVDRWTLSGEVSYLLFGVIYLLLLLAVVGATAYVLVFQLHKMIAGRRGGRPSLSMFFGRRRIKLKRGSSE